MLKFVTAAVMKQCSVDRKAALAAAVDAFDFSAFRRRQRGKDVACYTGSWKGKDFATFAEYAPFVLAAAQIARPLQEAVEEACWVRDCRAADVPDLLARASSMRSY
jgi:hypothetical protein